MFPLWQSRIGLVGRSFVVREVRFDALGTSPTVGGITLRACGPMGLRSLASLALVAEAEARAVGHDPDAFVIVGLGGVGLVALVPAHPPQDRADRDRILRLLGMPMEMEKRPN